MQIDLIWRARWTFAKGVYIVTRLNSFSVLTALICESVLFKQYSIQHFLIYLQLLSLVPIQPQVELHCKWRLSYPF
jgi:hypothetical protein